MVTAKTTRILKNLFILLDKIDQKGKKGWDRMSKKDSIRTETMMSKAFCKRNGFDCDGNRNYEKKIERIHL